MKRLLLALCALFSLLLLTPAQADAPAPLSPELTRALLQSVVDAPKPGNSFAATTPFYAYSINTRTSSISYVGSSTLPAYTVSAAATELQSMGCYYSMQLAGSQLGAQFSWLTVDMYVCRSWGSVAGIAYPNGSNTAGAIFWYVLL
jgi:hypothetical protein